MTPLDILEPGGTLIVASACSEGFGSAEFRDAQKRLCVARRRRIPRDAARQATSPTSTSGRREMQLKSMRAGARAALHDRPGNEADRA